MPALKELTDAGVAADGQSEGQIGQRMASELVKSYGFTYDAAKHEWDWSAGNIAEAFRESPVWTSIDYLTLAVPVAKWGTAMRAAAKGSGAAGQAYRAAQAGTRVAALERAPQTAVGRVLGAVTNPQFARATELSMEGPARTRVGRFFENPTAGFRRSPGAPGDYYRLVKAGFGDAADKHGLERMLKREQLADEAANEVLAARAMKKLNALAPEQGEQVRAALGRGMLSPERLRAGRDLAGRRGELYRSLSEKMGGDAGLEAYEASWAFREKLHRQAYDLKLLGRDTFARNLGKYAPNLYEEFLDAERKAGSAALTGPGGSRASFKARTLDRERDALSRRASKLRNRADELKRFADEDPKARKASARRAMRLNLQAEKLLARKAGIGDELTQILDPRATVGRMLKASQTVAKQRYAQRLASSVVAQDGHSVVEWAARQGDEQAAAAMARLAGGKRVAQEAIDDIADRHGWRTMRAFFHGRELPPYLKRLESTGLLDRYLDPAAADSIMETFKFADSSSNAFEKIHKALYRAAATFRVAKTAWNPSTHARNTLSGIVFNSLATGRFALAPTRGIKAIRENGRDWLEAAQAGVTSGTDHHVTLDFLRKAGLEKDNGVVSFGWLGNGKVAKALQSGAAKAENLYRLEDEAWKMQAFVSIRDRYLKTGKFTRQEAVSRAALEVTKFMPSFNMQSQWTKLISPVIPFSSFTNEALRIWKNTMAEKPHLAIFWSHFGQSMSEAFGAMAGYSQEELEAIHSRLPDFQHGKPSMLLPFKIDGKPHFYDLSYIIPLAGNMGEIEHKFATGEASLATPVTELFDPSQNPLFGVTSVLSTGVDPFTQRPVEPRLLEKQFGATFKDPNVRRTVGIAEWMAQTMLPPWVPPGYAGLNLLEVARGQVDPNTAQPLEPDLARTIAANIFGQRTYEASMATQITNARLDQQRITERRTEAWKRWERAKVSGDVLDMQDAEADIVAQTAKLLGNDPGAIRAYVEQGKKKREPGKFRRLTTRQMQESLQRSEGLEMNEADLEIRGELMSRIHERKKPKRKRRSRKRETK